MLIFGYLVVGLDFFFDIFTIATFFAFKKQRKFPTCIVGLMCFVDLMHFLRELIKGSPIPYINEYFYWNESSTSCATLYLWAAWVEAAQYVLSISLAIIIYLGVVKKMDFSYESNKQCFWVVAILFVVYPIVYITIVGEAVNERGYSIFLTSCGPKSNAGPIIGIVQCFLAIIIIMSLIGASLKNPLYVAIGDSDDKTTEQVYVWQIVKSINNLSYSSEMKRAWITIRFVLIILLQAAPRLAFNINYLLAAIPTTSTVTLSHASWATSIVVLVCYYLNAVVILWGNKPLHKWLLQRYVAIITNRTNIPAFFKPSVAQENYKQKTDKFELQEINCK